MTDVDRAKAFYVDKAGFHADHDHTVNDHIRFVQLTPPRIWTVRVRFMLAGMPVQLSRVLNW